MTPPWVIIAGDFTPGGGMDQANYQLAWHLAERLRRDVHLVSHHVAGALATHPRVQIHKVPRPFRTHLLGSPLLDVMGRLIARRLRAIDPHTQVVVNGGNCLLRAVNWVHMVHHACPRADHEAPWFFRLRNQANRARARARERKALRASSLVIANSYKTRDDLIRQLGVAPEKIHVVYLGVDSNRFRPPSPEERAAARISLNLPQDASVFLFIGALGYDRNKGFDTLLRGWRRLAAASGPPGLLVAAGSGRLDYWQRQIDALGLGAQVRLIGHTDRISEWMTAADMLVSPTHYDAYGLAVHEALCSGLPALVSRTAGVAERYPSELRDLVLLDPDDVDELAGRINQCRADWKGLRSRIAPFGAALRGRTWELIAHEVIQLADGMPAHAGC